jgi:uncharacterized protein DUF2336
VRARLSIYPKTPAAIISKLNLRSCEPEEVVPTIRHAQPASERLTQTPLQTTAMLSMRPNHASEINDMFFGAGASDRALILHNLAEALLQPSAPIPAERAIRAADVLEKAALAGNTEQFTRELSEALILPTRIAARLISDPGGEPLACAAKALGMPSHIFQRIVIFIPLFGSSVNTVYRLSRLYDRLSERSALIMLAAWRGSSMLKPPVKHRPALYDDERHRARSGAAQPRSTPKSSGLADIARNTIRGSRN